MALAAAVGLSKQPQNKVGEQGLLVPRFTGNSETLRQEEGGSLAQAAVMPSQATPSSPVGCSGARAKTASAAEGLRDTSAHEDLRFSIKNVTGSPP